MVHRTVLLSLFLCTTSLYLAECGSWGKGWGGGARTTGNGRISTNAMGKGWGGKVGTGGEYSPGHNLGENPSSSFDNSWNKPSGGYYSSADQDLDQYLDQYTREHEKSNRDNTQDILDAIKAYQNDLWFPNRRISTTTYRTLYDDYPNKVWGDLVYVGDGLYAPVTVKIPETTTQDYTGNYLQTFFLTQYKDSRSSYRDLLTGLTMYNKGRSSNYRETFYYDEYNPRSLVRTDNFDKNDATCTLKISEKGKIEVLKIPCVIVSTFSEEKHTVSNTNEKYGKFGVCITNSTVTEAHKLSASELNMNSSNVKLSNTSLSDDKIVEDNSFVEGKTTTRIVKVIKGTKEIRNVTVCTAMVDPLSVEGPPIDPAGKECTVGINTNINFYKKMDCSILAKNSKITKSVILPEKKKLKSWLENPPWWMSLFIAV